MRTAETKKNGLRKKAPFTAANVASAPVRGWSFTYHQSLGPYGWAAWWITTRPFLSPSEP
ncbi:hypothetical protein OHR86_14305 [Streptomyces sp. NBC_00441]|uniref:hypothetical protein n=1 Tax=Streptomyces sp. NBC_00441 TaxID=2975742 RepID=UPI002E284CC5|nr:hypothetical protein [Streptomyces sp. NBC_00441]